MLNPTGLVTVTLGWVVLDRPDQSGVYIAKDLASGWAYLVADQDGDTRYRGQGPCAGGVDVALRCAFLSAAACVLECASMRILVDTRVAHRAMVRLALHDPRVAAVIGGRQVSVMTRPLERSALLVEAAAERAASTALRTREREEWHDIQAPADTTTEIGNGGAGTESPGETGWRARQTAAKIAPAGLAQPALPIHRRPVPGHPVPGHSVPGHLVPEHSATGRISVLKRLVGPLLGSARTSLTTVGIISTRPKPPRGRLLNDWLHDLDGWVETVRTDLEDVGA
jgi:hypothetical protein